MKTLIHDDKMVKDFFKLLPELERDEVFLCMAQVRRKYTDTRDFGHDPIVMKQLFRNTDPEHMLMKLRGIEAKALASYNFNTGELFPHDALVIYFDLSPKSMIKAYGKFQSQTAQRIDQVLATYQNMEEFNDFSSGVDYNPLKRLDVDFLSNLHKSNSQKYFFGVDLDDKKLHQEVLELLEYDDMMKNVAWITETRGGYHYIFHKTKETGNYIMNPRGNFQENFKDADMEFKGNPMTPIPGTVQGGFWTKMIYH